MGRSKEIKIEGRGWRRGWRKTFQLLNQENSN